MDKWVSNTLLPSLFEKWQNRDRQYHDIIVSDRVAGILSDNMRQATTAGCFKTIVVGMECEWDGRTVFLRQRGRYQFVSFGENDEERAKRADFFRRQEMEKELERARKAVERGKPERIEKMLSEAKREAESYTDVDEEDEEDYQAISLMWANHYQQIVSILEGR